MSAHVQLFLAQCATFFGQLEALSPQQLRDCYHEMLTRRIDQLTAVSNNPDDLNISQSFELEAMVEVLGRLEQRKIFLDESDESKDRVREHMRTTSHARIDATKLALEEFKACRAVIEDESLTDDIRRTKVQHIRSEFAFKNMLSGL